MLRVHDAIASEPAALVLFSDPLRPARGQSAALLQLLGLTPAEARLAVHISQWLPPRAAAEALGITVSTARSKLKTIYSKLAIVRQSQRANLVARLDSA